MIVERHSERMAGGLPLDCDRDSISPGTNLSITGELVREIRVPVVHTMVEYTWHAQQTLQVLHLDTAPASIST